MRGLMFVLVVSGCGRLGFDSHDRSDAGADAYTGCPVIAAAAGREHTCAVDAKGQVWCFGHNDLGQVQFGGPKYVVTPTLVPLPTAAVQVAAGRDFSCARLVDGSVQCWGDGTLGQHGDSGVVSGGPRAVALGLDAAVDLAVGAHTACVVRASDHAVECWGAGQYFQTGQSSMTQHNLSVVVAGTAGSQKVKLGHRNGCALQATGELQCWGRNTAGQLGTGDKVDRPGAVLIGTTSMLDVAAGGTDTCVVDDTGTVRCTGDNTVGQLGNGNFVDTSTFSSPVLTDGSAVATSSYGTCAKITGDKMACWGAAGPGPSLLTSPTTIAVEGVTDVMAGYYHMCAIYGGALGCWGSNEWGQLGRGFSSIAPVPSHIAIDSVLTMAVGSLSVCAVATGNVYCWGDNTFGALGDGTLTSSAKPRRAMITALGSIDGVTTGEAFACAWGGGQLACWGRSDNGQLGTTPDATIRQLVPTLVPGLANVTYAAAGTAHVCAINAGSIKCWGANASGQLGNGTTTDSIAPVTVMGSAGTTQLTAASLFACAIANNTVICWGDNGGGQLGDGTKVNRSVPITVALPGTPLEVSAGAFHTCALNLAGEVYCWGHNTTGQLGQGDTAERLTPIRVVLPGTAIHVAAGDAGSCAVLATHDVYCWGRILSTVDASPSPTHLAPLDGADVVEMTGGIVCTQTAVGSMFCWGDPEYAGNQAGTDIESNPAPAAIPPCN